MTEVQYKAGQFADNRSLTSLASQYQMGLAPGLADWLMTVLIGLTGQPGNNRSSTSLASPYRMG
jgi:hypothetical protein